MLNRYPRDPHKSHFCPYQKCRKAIKMPRSTPSTWPKNTTSLQTIATVHYHDHSCFPNHHRPGAITGHSPTDLATNISCGVFVVHSEGIYKSNWVVFFFMQYLPTNPCSYIRKFSFSLLSSLSLSLLGCIPPYGGAAGWQADCGVP